MNKILGRLIFFLYPDDNNIQLIKNIFMDEFVIYPVNDPDKLYKLLIEFPSSIIFINTDFNNKFNWKNFVQKISEDKMLNEVSVNIVCSINKNEISFQNIDNVFYLNEKTFDEDLIIKYLENNYAKVRRKYIRIELEGKNKIEFSVKINDNMYKGFITNISSSAGVFNFNNKSIQIELGIPAVNIEFKIAEISYNLSGIVYRDIESFDENLYVIIFDRAKMKEQEITGIQDYIYGIMQEMMEKKLANI